jgi:hypothetical protein
MSIGSEPDVLKSLQKEIYRDKVLRARAMSPTERLDEALELSNDIYTWMLDGAKSQCRLSSNEEGWVEVQRRLQTLRTLQEKTLYQPIPTKFPTRQFPTPATI